MAFARGSNRSVGPFRSYIGPYQRCDPPALLLGDVIPRNEDRLVLRIEPPVPQEPPACAVLAPQAEFHRVETVLGQEPFHQRDGGLPMLLHQFAQGPVQQLMRGVSEDFLPRRVEKFQLAVETSQAQQGRRWVGGEPAIAAYESGEAR